MMGSIYNQERFHQALDNLTPDEVYNGGNDDLIKRSGYGIQPTEVEDALLRHPTVAEAAVVGSPDLQRDTIVNAFVRLRVGAVSNDALFAELQSMVKTKGAGKK